MATSQNELSPQFARLFYAAGLLEKPDWDIYGHRHQKHKPILDVLTQEVSLGAFKDLLFSEISLRSKLWTKPADSGLHQGLTATAMINDDELRHLLAAFRPTVAQALAPLAEQDGQDPLDEGSRLDAEALARAWATWGDRPVESYDWAFAEGLLSAQAVCQWLSRHEGPHMRLAALYLSLYLLCSNQQLAERDFAHCLRMLSPERLEELLGHIKGRLGMHSRWFAERLEARLTLPEAAPAAIEVAPELLAMVPQSLVRRQMMIPYRIPDGGLALATSDPLNVSMTTLVHWITGAWPLVFYAPGQQIIERINRLYTPQGGTETLPNGTVEIQAAGAMPPSAERKSAVAAPRSAAPPAAPGGRSAGPRRENDIVVDNMSAVQLVSSLIESAVEMQTTDIHIEPAKAGMLVRFRIDGELHRIMTIPESLVQSVISRVKVLANMDVTERRRPQDGHFELRVDTHNFDFRISTLPAVLGEKVVIRILDEARVRTGLDQLGMLPEQLRLFEKIIEQPYGLTLVTGPTGSGKTSTLYAALNILNRENRNLVTIEDPVEYQVEGINQVQVDPHIGLNFSEGLRSVLRQDPDVIMVGEIRDGDTAHNAIRAAMTGHLVFSTLHTNMALGAVDALVHLGAAPFMVAGSLIGILSQRLLRRLCGKCKSPLMTTPAINRQLGLDEKLRKRIFKPGGCEECLRSGYQGRTAAFEVIRVTEPLRPLIMQRKLAELEHHVRGAKMIGLAAVAAQKVLDGVTSVDEAMRKVMMEN